MGNIVSALGIIALAIGLCCKCFWNKMSCVHKHSRPGTLPNNDTCIELQPITNPVPEISDQLSLVQEILKASGVDMSNLNITKMQSPTSDINSAYWVFRSLKSLQEFPYDLWPANLVMPIKNSLPLLKSPNKTNFGKSSLMVHNQQICPYKSGTHNSMLIPTYICLACL